MVVRVIVFCTQELDNQLEGKDGKEEGGQVCTDMMYCWTQSLACADYKSLQAELFRLWQRAQLQNMIQY
jgi:hypothetical protein